MGISAFILDVAIIGITIQSGYISLVGNNTEGWRLAENQFLINLKSAYDRIIDFNNLA